MTPDGAVTLRSSMTFPSGKTLELAFVGTREAEAYGLKHVVQFVRVPLEGEAPPPECYPVVLLVRGW